MREAQKTVNQLWKINYNQDCSNVFILASEVKNKLIEGKYKINENKTTLLFGTESKDNRLEQIKSCPSFSKAVSSLTFVMALDQELQI